MEDPNFAKQNDRDSAARPLTDIPTKLLKQGFDVPPRQAAAYGTREDQLKGELVIPHNSTHGTAFQYHAWLPVNGLLDTDHLLLGGSA